MANFRLLLLVSILNISFAEAQDKKPSKEETIAFISWTINECKGFELPFSFGRLGSVKFDGNTLEYKTYQHWNGSTFSQTTEIYEDINWAKLVEEEIDFNSSERGESDYYEILFDQNMKTITVYDSFVNDASDETKTSFQSNLYIFIPSSKAESIKKAFLRLKEIATEENRDPFKN